MEPIYIYIHSIESYQSGSTSRASFFLTLSSGASRVCTAPPRKMWNGAVVFTRKMASLDAWDQLAETEGSYALVMTNIAMENGHL